MCSVVCVPHRLCTCVSRVCCAVCSVLCAPCCVLHAVCSVHVVLHVSVCVQGFPTAFMLCDQKRDSHRSDKRRPLGCCAHPVTAFGGPEDVADNVVAEEHLPAQRTGHSDEPLDEPAALMLDTAAAERWAPAACPREPQPSFLAPVLPPPPCASRLPSTGSALPTRSCLQIKSGRAHCAQGQS